MHKLKSSPQDYNARILWHFLVDAEQQTNGLYINKSTVHCSTGFQPNTLHNFCIREREMF